MTSRQVFDADHEAFRNSVARFLAAEAVPKYPAWEIDGAVPAAFYAAAATYGFVGPGGAGVADPRFAAVVLEEAMAAGLPAIALAVAMNDSFALPLLAGGGAPDLAAVVDPASSAVRAEAYGDGWILTGTAETVVSGLAAQILVVGARTDDGSELLFALDASRVQRAPADDLLGLGACDVADLTFAAVAVTPADRIDGAALDRARAGHQLALAVAAVAGARAALTMTVVYVQQRKAFGRPIAEFQNTRRVLGELGARVEAVQAFVDACLAGPGLSATRAAAAKLCATDLLAEAVDTGVQLHGGYGYMVEYPIARAYAAARFFRLHGGVGDHQEAALADALGL